MSFVTQMLEEMGWGDSSFVRKKKIRSTLKDYGCEHNKATEFSTKIYEFLRENDRRASSDKTLASTLFDELMRLKVLVELTKRDPTEEGVEELLTSLIVAFKY